MKIVELLIDELEEMLGFDAVALVQAPAHEAEFHAFDSKDVEDAIAFQVIKLAFMETLHNDDISHSLVDKQDTYKGTKENLGEKQSFALDGDQQMVVGPLMIPDKLIFRVDENNEPYYCYFSKDTIKQIAQKMMREKLLDRVNLEHDMDSPVESYMVESWLVEDRLKDKQQAYGFDYPAGTWMGMYKVENPIHWEMVKQGKVKGFSVEGYFADKLIQK